METDDLKRAIAQDFVDKHKWGLHEWPPLESSDDEKLLEIYHCLVEGSYSEVRKDGDLYEIEIPKHESATHQTVLFTWEQPEPR